jgi:hypothetical protein
MCSYSLEEAIRLRRGLGVVVERVLSTRGSGFKPWYLLLPPKKVRVYRRVSLGGHRCVVDVLEPFCISQP